MFLSSIPMKTHRFLWAVLITAAFCNFASAQENVSDVLNDRALNMKLPADRAKAVKRMKEIEDKNLEKAKQIANRRGMPLRENLPNGRSRVLVGVDDNGELLYYEDRNSNAAISTSANKLHTSPYSINGSGVRVGVWENDSPRNSHQEFNDGPTSRINLAQSTSFGDHATHVAGIIGAFGVTPSAKGMAYQTIVDAYTAVGDTSEMTAAAATGPGQQATKLYVSNHSYGFTYGWKSVSGVMTWSGTGTDQNAYDPDFGRYSTTTRSFDSLHYNSPYYLAFWAAGNENTDGPSTGQSCSIGGSTVTYNPSIHPKNDGQYSGGFDTLGDHTTGKNVMVIGAGICLLEFTDRRALEAQLATLQRRLGAVLVPGRDALLERLREELAAYFAGARREFTVPLVEPGTPFERRVWEALLAIPYGETRSYAGLARAIGSPGASRAVGSANGRNRIAIVVPCHRVVNADGELGGYGGGLWRKRWLLDLERGRLATGTAGPGIDERARAGIA